MQYQYRVRFNRFTSPAVLSRYLVDQLGPSGDLWGAAPNHSILVRSMSEAMLLQVVMGERIEEIESLEIALAG